MELCLRIALLLLLVTGTLTQEEPTPAKPKEQPKVPVKPDSDGGLDLSDALGPGGFGLDLEDALGPGNEDPYSKPDKPAVKPPNCGGGGRNFDLSDLEDVIAGDYKPDGGRPGGDPKSSKPSGGHDSGFKLEDALRPVYQRFFFVEKLNEILENQKLLLKQRAPSSRFYNGR